MGMVFRSDTGEVTLIIVSRSIIARRMDEDHSSEQL
jgi:hypothetical protein